MFKPDNYFSATESNNNRVLKRAESANTSRDDKIDQTIEKKSNVSK